MASVRFLTVQHFRLRWRYPSTRLRVWNLLPYWPEAGLWWPGKRPEVLVLQKVYRWFPRAPLTILDVSDPDWERNPWVMSTVERVDAVTCSTQAIADVLQSAARRVVVIPDRHDVTNLPSPRRHEGAARRLIWFGMHHNARALAELIPTIEAMDVSLTVVSNRDPLVHESAARPASFRQRCAYHRFRWRSIHSVLSQHDIALVPPLETRVARFKSDNRESLALLCGVPSARSPDELLDLAHDGRERSRRAVEGRTWALEHRDCRQSVAELKSLVMSLAK